MKCCVYTRSFLENPYLDFFIEHYINLGFDKIIILKSDDESYKFSENISSLVEIHNVKNTGNKMIQEHIKLITESEYDWIFFPDIDEFLLLENKYKNIKEYIQSKLNSNNNINTFYFRWGIIEKYDLSNKSFKSILSDYTIFSSLFIKSMVNRKSINLNSDPHIFELNTEPIIYFEGSIINTNNKYQDIKFNSYDDHILVHIHTRSIHNMIIKALSTVIKTKIIMSLDTFIKYVNNFNNTDISINDITTIIGAKAGLPFSHSISPVAVLDINNYRINDSKLNIINTEEESKSILRHLLKNNIDKDKYYKFVESLNNLIQKNHRIFFKR